MRFTKTACAVAGVTVVVAALTGGTASAGTSAQAPNGASVDGLNAPVWDAPPLGFSPGRNPQSGSAGPFLSPGAKASLSAEMAVDRTTSSARSSDAAPSQALIGCSPATGADDPHISSTGWAASGHGWWDKGSCSGSTAHVTGRLYEWYTNGSSGGWVFKAKAGPTQLRPYSSGGGRVTARKDCEAGNLTDWLNVVDVDVDGQVDNSDVGERQNDITCRVWS
jgi:hypothetical protein